MSAELTIVHYLNQFFGGVGGEDKADLEPQIIEGPVGPGIALQNGLKDNGKIVATVICGDNYYAEKIDEANERVIELLKPYAPGAVIAGPAFNAGRYGIACGAFCKAVQDNLHIPAVTGMYEDNPGTDIYRRHVYIIETLDSARGMSDAVPKMVNLLLKLHFGREIGLPPEDGYLPRGFLKEVFSERTGAERAIDLLLNKVAGKKYVSEIHASKYEHIRPAPPLLKPGLSKIALVTDGGLVPKGNPDKIEAMGATRYGRYSIEGMKKLTAGSYEVAHIGYAHYYIDEDPNRLVPLDVVRDLENEGLLGKIDTCYYTTAGVAGSVESAKKVAYGIVEHLKLDGVNAVILTST
jgi:betaine reductase